MKLARFFDPNREEYLQHQLGNQPHQNQRHDDEQDLFFEFGNGQRHRATSRQTNPYSGPDSL